MQLKKWFFNGMNLTGQKTVIIGIGNGSNFSFKKNLFIKTNHNLFRYLFLNSFNHLLNYLNFNVTTANTTVKMVTTQKRTAILLS